MSEKQAVSEKPKEVQGETQEDGFSREDVKKHNKKSDAWLVLHNKVYDITKFLDDHPGGSEVLVEKLGPTANTSKRPLARVRARTQHAILCFVLKLSH